jgi:hypothetical protein
MPKRPRTTQLQLQTQLQSTKSSGAACSLDDSLNPQRQLSIMSFMNPRKRPLVCSKPNPNETTITTTTTTAAAATTLENDWMDPSATTTATTTTPAAVQTPDALLDRRRPRMVAVTPVKEQQDTKQQRQPTTTTITNNKNKKKQPKLAQLFLDLGQANFGKQTECSICGMLTVHGVEEDRHQHEQICATYTNGVEFHVHNYSRRRSMGSGSGTGGAGARVVSRISSTAMIVEIRPTDPSAWQHKLQECLSICNQELGFAVNTTSSSTTKQTPRTTTTTAFLYVAHHRVVGLVTAEPITCGYWMETASERSLTPQKALVGIYQLWTLRNRRGQGIATRLVDAARSRLVFGMQVPPSQVAFSSPTQAGLAFAKMYAPPQQPPLVYEYHPHT